MTPKCCDRICSNGGQHRFRRLCRLFPVWNCFGITLAFRGFVTPADWLEALSGGSDLIDRSRDSQHVRKL